ncbi:RodZ domain-containing protein [Oceanibaculum nanhaiense]|uniref:helix-turn-helix domain-containing protein n=1 Tax=Oceanibaculum nanhaiense TaxID=1909734 RepID=UPI003F6F96B8
MQRGAVARCQSLVSPVNPEPAAVRKAMGGEGVSVEGDVLKSKNRLNFLEIEEVSGAAKSAETPSGVGLRLAQAREGAGYSIADVAGYLRVRKNYLEAIEAERYDALPGRTYAIGFVRAYAELLGLDAARLVNEFKAETTALKGRTELVFPSPPPEGRIPGGAILFVSVLVALLAYGGWYYVSVTEKGVAELVPAVPERLVALLEGGRAAEPVATEPVATEEPSARQAVAATARDEEPPLPAPATATLPTPALTRPAVTAPAATVAPVPPRAADPVLSQATSQATPLAAPQAVPQPVPPAATDIVAAPSLAPAAPATPAVSAPASTPASEEESTPEPSSISGTPTNSGPALAAREPAASEERVSAPVTAQNSATQNSATQAPAAAPEPSQTSASQTSAPQTLASLPAASAGASGAPEAGPTVGPRIVLNATDEVWLQIRDGDNALVTRILRKGDSYRVPNRSGLTLLTGNAGALEILVDGRPAPTLGPLGAVRRDVALDPQSLLAGASARQ